MRSPQQPRPENQHGADGQGEDEADGAIGIHRTDGAAAAVRAWCAAWLPVIVWVALIAWLSGDGFSDERTADWLARWPVLAWLGLTPAVIAPVNLILRKSAHLVEYAILSMLSYRALGATGTRSPSWRALGALSLALACAALDELHQSATLSRGGSLHDVVLDGAGAVAGALLAVRGRRGRAERVP